VILSDLFRELATLLTVVSTGPVKDVIASTASLELLDVAASRWRHQCSTWTTCFEPETPGPRCAFIADERTDSGGD
jgi:hypothetical protein